MNAADLNLMRVAMLTKAWRRWRDRGPHLAVASNGHEKKLVDRLMKASDALDQAYAKLQGGPDIDANFYVRALTEFQLAYRDAFQLVVSDTLPPGVVP